jgi:hypothetical protein
MGSYSVASRYGALAGSLLNIPAHGPSFERYRKPEKTQYRKFESSSLLAASEIVGAIQWLALVDCPHLGHPAEARSAQLQDWPERPFFTLLLPCVFELLKLSLDVRKRRKRKSPKVCLLDFRANSGKHGSLLRCV